MVVNVLASNDGSFRSGHSLTALHTLIGKLGTFLLETGFDGGLVSVSDMALLDATHAVLVLLGQNLAVLDGLDGCVVVILVDLLVDGGLLLFDPRLVHRLLNDGGGDPLMHGGVMVTSLVPAETSTCQLEFPT